MPSCHKHETENYERIRFALLKLHLPTHRPKTCKMSLTCEVTKKVNSNPTSASIISFLTLHTSCFSLLAKLNLSPKKALTSMVCSWKVQDGTPTLVLSPILIWKNCIQWCLSCSSKPSLKTNKNQETCMIVLSTKLGNEGQPTSGPLTWRLKKELQNGS